MKRGMTLVFAAGLMASCNTAVSDRLDQCSAALERERQITHGDRRINVGGSVLDVSTLTDRLSDLELELDVMDADLRDAESLEELRGQQDEVKSRFHRLQEALHFALENHFDHCYSAR